MALVPFPRVIPHRITIDRRPSTYSRASEYSRAATHLFSRGASPWFGTITWPRATWRPGLSLEFAANFNEVVAFLDSCDGVLNTFDIPLSHIMHDAGVRFPSHAETTAANSVKVIGQTPDTSAAPQVGLSATLELDVASAAGVGLRQGDYISLKPAAPADFAAGHGGAYRVTGNQAGANVAVRPAPVWIDYAGGERYAIQSRAPTLRARLAAPPPSVRYDGVWHESLTVQWEQA